jgi:hypothetical protein
MRTPAELTKSHSSAIMCHELEIDGGKLKIRALISVLEYAT